jgi:carbamoyl-phosphate synthase large subunit
MVLAYNASGDRSVVVSKFMTNAKEVDVDGVCDGKNVFIGGILEHVENAGRHSGDATMCFPSINLDERTKEQLRDSTRRIASALRIKGPFNIQFMVKDRKIYVIECNLRASRSMPFVSKSIGVNLMALAEAAIMGGKVKPGEGTPKRYGVKSPQFSFMPLEGADPVGGVEMESTGESACFGDTFEEALIESMMATGLMPPAPGDSVLLSIGKDKPKIIPLAAKLSRLGLKLYATDKTARAIVASGLECETLRKVSENVRPNILDYLSERKISMVFNIPQINGDRPRQKFEDGYAIRRKAIEFRVPVITNLELAEPW